MCFGFVMYCSSRKIDSHTSRKRHPPRLKWRQFLWIPAYYCWRTLKTLQGKVCLVAGACKRKQIGHSKSPTPLKLWGFMNMAWLAGLFVSLLTFPHGHSKLPSQGSYSLSSPSLYDSSFFGSDWKGKRPNPKSSEQWLRSRFNRWVWQSFFVWSVEAQAPVQTQKIQLLWRHRGCFTPCCFFPQWEPLPSWFWLSIAGWKWFGTLRHYPNLAARLKMNNVKTRTLLSKRSMGMTAQCFLRVFRKCMSPMTAAFFMWIASTCRAQTLLIENSNYAKIAQLSYDAESWFASYSARLQLLPCSAVFSQMTLDNERVTG